MRINPKLAQMDHESSSKIQEKEVRKSVNPNNLSLLQIDPVTKVIAEDSFEDKSSNFYETPKSILETVENPQQSLDSYRKYASEHEQELKVKPEKLENIQLTESESSYSGLNIELRQ